MAIIAVETSSSDVRTGRKAESRRGPRRARASVLLSVVLWCLLAYFLLPLLWLVVNSTKSNGDLFTTFGLAFGDTFALFDNIASLARYQDGIFFRWFATTVLYAGVGATGAALIASM